MFGLQTCRTEDLSDVVHRRVVMKLLILVAALEAVEIWGQCILSGAL